ncbi:hypothetical protein BDW02DRAFT_286302 [Decorospora gaudefroyi]|uniref:DUF3824 domain-containing protein n=1 Tax=Decorospora gaudefroyi TaxID=184978 RepID=A0A6A5KJ48_9PLEO|nr:hypothetical protein BDW02DRAFT_286302 [Decorospora gaudefroyi]
MSEYSYAPRHRNRDPEYVTETTYIERGGRGGGAVRDLVYRPAREDSIEEIPRDFPPGAEYRGTKYREEYAPPRRTRSVNRGYDDDSYYSRGDRARRPRDRDYDDYSEYSERPKPSRRKSIVEQVKDFGESAGLGGIIGAVTGRSRSRSRSRSRFRRDDRGYDSDRYAYYDERDRRSRYGSRSRSSSRGGRKSEKWEQAAKAALVAGAVEAFRSRKEAGPWTGVKGQRVATAALGAAGIDGLIDRDPEKHEKRHVAEAALGGLVASRLANGSRSRSRARGDSRSRSLSRSRSRSRSRARSLFSRSRSRGRSRSHSSDGGHPLAKVAGTGAVLAAGKALYDRVRSKSRSRKDRSRSSSSDSYVPSRGGNRRSYSRGRGMDDQYSQAPSGTNPDRRLAAAGGAGAGALAAQDGGGYRSRRDSSSSESSTDMEAERKKLRGKELLTAGLATVATIHAAHGVYTSMVASENRRKLVGEGEMTQEEARKRKSKNMLQDAAAVGIAALGIKSAYSEWKDMNEQRHSVKELEQRRRKRRKARERREREARLNALGGMNGAGANPYAYPVAANQQYPPPPVPVVYADANPYGNTMPPPPMGARY